MGGRARTYRRKFPARRFHRQGSSRSKSNRFAYTNWHGNTNSDANANFNTYTKVCAHAEVSSNYSRAAPVTRIADTESVSSCAATKR
jgi:hypothetical protein